VTPSDYLIKKGVFITGIITLNDFPGTAWRKYNLKFWDLFIDNAEKKRVVKSYLSVKIPSDYENFRV
jgi:hypothetical protein